MMLVRLSALSGLAALAASSATAAPPFNASLPVTRVNHQAPPVIPFPIGPAKTLPNLDGTGYPPCKFKPPPSESTSHCDLLAVALAQTASSSSTASAARTTPAAPATTRST